MNSRVVVALAGRFLFPRLTYVAGDGRRVPGRLPERLRSALSGGGNEGVVDAGDGGLYVWCGGALTFIGVATEGLLLDWMLDCGRHRRRCTPHGMAPAHSLVCRYCARPSTLVCMKLKPPSHHERSAHQLLAILGLGAALRPETRLPGWPGALDFFLPAPRLAIQVDGEGHFTKRMFGEPTAAQRATDLRMAAWAWQQGLALLRVHHADVSTHLAPLIGSMHTHRAAHPTTPLLVLTCSFAMGAATSQPGTCPAACYIEALARTLPDACARTGPVASLWFVPRPAPPTM